MQITITTAANLVGASRRTMRRRIGETMDGMVDLEVVRPQLAIDADDSMILAADRGDAPAQTEIAVLLLQASQPDAAVYWLLKAATRSTEAMHHLSRCYIEGVGVPQDLHTGMMWLHKAAAGGHAIAKAQADAILGSATRK
jgi:uncharacterized protein